MGNVTILQAVLGVALSIAIAWRMHLQRAGFQSKRTI